MRRASIIIHVGGIGFWRKLRLRQHSTVAQALQQAFHSQMRGALIILNGRRTHRTALLAQADVLLAVYPIKGAATVKRNGKIWRYHKNDPDIIFPSDFHLHNTTSPEVLDMYTGYVYDIRTRRPIGVISKKDMCRLHGQLSHHADKSISSRCMSDPKKFPYLASR